VKQDLWRSWLGKRPREWGRRTLPAGYLARFTQRVFVSGEASLDLSFTAAQARLTYLIRGGWLGNASAQAYSDGITGLAWLGPLGPALCLSKLVQARFQDLKASGDSARLALRWEVAGPSGGLFPALDADMTLTPAGEHSTTLRLTGVYRTPLGTAGADWMIVHRVATATIRAFLHLITEATAGPARTARPATEAADEDPPEMPPEPDTP
jgi:hypothetical protein